MFKDELDLYNFIKKKFTYQYETFVLGNEKYAVEVVR